MVFFPATAGDGGKEQSNCDASESRVLKNDPTSRKDMTTIKELSEGMDSVDFSKYDLGEASLQEDETPTKLGASRDCDSFGALDEDSFDEDNVPALPLDIKSTILSLGLLVTPR